MRRTLGPLAAVVMLALIVAGCSNVPAGTGAGSSGNDTAATHEEASPALPTPAAASSGGDTTAATREQAVRFAQCMRANGVSEFPDPDASGALTIDGVINGSSLDPSTAAWQKAIGACQDLEPPGFMGHTRSAQEQANALKFAQCVRDNGVKDFPDPAPDGPLIDTSRIPSAAGKGAHSIPGFQAAVQKCRDFLAGALTPGAPGGQP